METAREGFIAVEGGRAWYRIAGDGPGVPLIALHGGPGISHEYLEPLAALGDERPIVFYDQLGGGRSDRPDDDSLWTVERFVRELALVRDHFALDEVHILGQSWGTMLAVDYVLDHSAGVHSLILGDACLSVERWARDADALIAALPEPERAIIQRHLDAGTHDAPEYLAALGEFHRRHLCRVQPWPEALVRSALHMNRLVYEAMWGPTDFYATGATRGYDRTPRLHELAMPVLFLCGRYDSATPETTDWYRSLVPDAEMAVFEESSHVPMNEEPEAFVRTVRDFLGRVERTG
jgi:proline iminopeptidase